MGEDGGGVIIAADAGAGDHEHEIRGKRCPPDLGGDRVRVVGLHIGDEGPGAGLNGSRGKQDGVAVHDVTWTELGADRLDLIPGRDDRDDRLPGDLQRGMAGRGGGGKVGRAQPAAGRDEQLTGLEVLADGPHMPSARCGTGDPRAAVGVDPDAFALYHGVHARWYRIAGVDPGERRGGEPARARRTVSGGTVSGGTVSGGTVRSYRDAIHRGAGGARRGPQGPDRGGCHPAEAVPDGDLLNGRHATPARVRAYVHPPGVGGIRAEPRAGRGSTRVISHAPTLRLEQAETAAEEQGARMRPPHINYVVRHILAAFFGRWPYVALVGIHRRRPVKAANVSWLTVVAHQEGALDEQAGALDRTACP